MRLVHKNFLSFLALFILLNAAGSAYSFSFTKKDTLLTGTWLGTISANGTSLRMVLKININDKGEYKGTLDSPDQKVKDIQIDSIAFGNGSLSFFITKVDGNYTGTLLRDSLLFEGIWKQMGISTPLNLQKVYGAAQLAKLLEPIPQAPKPQEPKRPFPYNEEEVTIENKTDSLTLSGTLSLPKGTGEFPAVVMITGSGQQDRDENLYGHKPFLLIADNLTRKGFAVLRMDDRGVGKSTGNFGKATTFDFVNDILAAVDYLKTRKDINKKQIGLIGHSEGGMIAPLAAVKSTDVAFIVLLAGPAVPGDELLLMQTELIARASGINEPSIQKSHLLMKSLYNILKRNLDSAKTAQLFTEVHNEFKEGLSDEEKTNPMFSDDIFNAQVKAITSPWYSTFIKYDPRPVLEKVKCPVLALNGQNDLQVPPKQNLQALKNALTNGGNKNFEVKELPGLNHLFQTSKTGAPADYGKNEETFSPDALKILSDWLLKTVNTLK